VLAEAFDDDPFAMLALRGKNRDDLLTALRGKTGTAAGPPPAHPGAAGASPAQALLADVTAVPLADSLADFWSPGLSQARLRALPPNPAAPPDLLLRLAAPPAVEVRGAPLLDVLGPVYARLADPGDAENEPRAT
jgi:uncharacterized Zn finger protein